MRVPEYDNKVNRTTPQISPPGGISPRSPQVPAGAFGGDVAQTTQKLGEVGKRIAENFIKMARDDQDKDVIKKETDYRLEMQNVISNQEEETITGPDQQTYTRPKGILNRQLSQAKGSTEDFDKQYFDLQKKYLEGLSNYQRDKLAPAIESYYIQLRNRVITHEYSQREADFKNTIESNLKQKVLDASVIRDPEQLNQAIIEAVAGYAWYGQRFDKDTRALQDEKIAMDITNSAINATFENIGIEQARGLLASVQDKVSPGNYEALKDNFEKGLKRYQETKNQQLIAMRLNDELTEAIVLQEQEKGHIKPGDAQTLIKSLATQKKDRPELDKFVKYNELVGRADTVSDGFFGIGRTPIENVIQLQADILKANADGYITDKQMKELLGDNQKKTFKDKRFKNAIKQLIAQSSFYDNDEAQIRAKAEMYQNLMEKVIAGKDPGEAVGEVITEKLNDEVSEAVKDEIDREKAVAGKIKMSAPQGIFYYIPAENVEAAKKRGLKVAK